MTNSHDVLDDDLIAPLLTRLAYPESPAPVSIEGAAVVYAGETGQWRAYLAFGSGTPTYRWEYRLVGSSCCVLNSRGRGGAIGTQEVPYNQWHYGGSGPTFERRVNGDAQVELRVHVSRRGATRTATRTVRYSTDSAYATSLARRPMPGHQPASAPAASALVRGDAYAPPRLAPNPTRGAVSISGDRAGPIRVVVYDPLGRQVLTAAPAGTNPGPFRVVLDTRPLPPGIYLARTETPTGAVSAPARLSVVR